MARWKNGWTKGFGNAFAAVTRMNDCALEGEISTHLFKEKSNHNKPNLHETLNPFHRFLVLKTRAKLLVM